jgi:hypothetical protein
MIIAVFSFICGMFTVIGYDELRHWRRAKLAAQQAELERHMDAHAPQPGTMARPNYSAVHCLDQVDAMIKRMDDAEMDDIIEEMQMRGW